MHRETSEPSLNPSSEDALSLFGAEAASSKTTSDSLVRPSTSAVERPSISASTSLPSVAIPTAVHVGSADRQEIPGAVAISRVLDAAPLRFVDGVAVVQALSAAAQSKGGRKAGMPDLQSVFLKDSGEVVSLGSSTGEPAARELARLLHRLVPSESTPPVGRLFIDRWTSGASTDLGEFTSELAYFARPNGRELLTAIYSKCASPAGPSAALPVVAPAAPIAVAEVARPPIPVAKPPHRAESQAVSWLKSHRRQIVFASAMVVATIVATAFAAWFWPSSTTTAAQTRETQPQTLSEGAQAEAPADAVSASRPGSKEPARKIASAAAAPRTRTAARTVAGDTRRPTPARAAGSSDLAAATVGAPSAAPSGAPSVDASETSSGVELASRAARDFKIYSESDAGVLPPKLRSAEIPEMLIAGFPTKTNAVELIVGQRGDVERVRMIGPPQRIPDIMLLSRVKEWLFEPAVKDGAAVRYRMVLTWNVTP